MIEKILEKFEELKVNDVCVWIPCSECEKRYGKNCDKAKQSLTIDKCKAIVQEVAKEYGKDTNVPSNGWIPCIERLPKPYKKVLVYEEDGEIYMAKYHEDIKRFSHVGSAWCVKENEVIAWSELPAPYQKGE